MTATSRKHQGGNLDKSIMASPARPAFTQVKTKTSPRVGRSKVKVWDEKSPLDGYRRGFSKLFYAAWNRAVLLISH
jgi:hypothetical protein